MPPFSHHHASHVLIVRRQGETRCSRSSRARQELDHIMRRFRFKTRSARPAFDLLSKDPEKTTSSPTMRANHSSIASEVHDRREGTLAKNDARNIWRKTRTREHRQHTMNRCMRSIHFRLWPMHAMRIIIICCCIQRYPLGMSYLIILHN